MKLLSKHPTGFKIQHTLLSSAEQSNNRVIVQTFPPEFTMCHKKKRTVWLYLWLIISTVPYCSIHSLPRMTLCTQQKGFVHVYASLCLSGHTHDQAVTRQPQNALVSKRDPTEKISLTLSITRNMVGKMNK